MPVPNLRLPAALSLILLASCGNYSGGGKGMSEKAPELPPLVRAAPIELRNVRRFIETTSYLESEHQVAVMSKISGRVREVLVDDGTPVEKGDVLARLDDREARSALAQVEVQLEDGVVKLALSKLEAEAAAARIEQAKIERDHARTQHQRNVEIDPGLISATELDQSKFALDTAEELLQVAGFNAKKADLEVKAAENAIQELSSKLEAEQLRCAEHEILAPIDGAVVECKVRGGETVSSSTELFVVVDREHLVSYLSRPQRELRLIQSAREVTFTAEAWPDREFKAAIDFVSPVVDQATGSFRMRIRIDEADSEVLRPGMFIRARVLTEEQRQALMVPKAAVLNEGEQAIVFVVRDGVARRIVLATGLEERDFIECANMGERGLSPGDLVVVSGQHDLRDQVAVEVSRD